MYKKQKHVMLPLTFESVAIEGTTSDFNMRIGDFQNYLMQFFT